MTESRWVSSQLRIKKIKKKSSCDMNPSICPWSQSGPSLCYQHPRIHFWLKKYQFLEPWQLPHETSLWTETETDKGLIRLEWSKRWNKSSTNSSFVPPGYGVRDEGTRKTRRDNMIQWMTTINHALQRTEEQRGKQTERKNENSRRAQRNKHIHTYIHSWARNRFSSNQFVHFHKSIDGSLSFNAYGSE